MNKEPTPELRIGLESLADLVGVVALGPPFWAGPSEMWAIPIRISAAVVSEETVPAVTDWFLLVDEDYPHGHIRIYPSKTGGITQTFPHQEYNGPGNLSEPWRTGNICTWTAWAPLRRKGYDVEPGSPDENLRWHALRAKAWVELASEQSLDQPGDPFELPRFPCHGRAQIAFCEGPATHDFWRQATVTWGRAETALLDTEPPILVITRFSGGRKEAPIQQEWKKAIDEEVGPEVAWVRINSVPVLPPFQIPVTWGELREACRIQGVRIDDRLRPAITGLLNTDAALLAGFPIPDKNGGEPSRMHWYGLRLPPMDGGAKRGFRNTDRGRWLAYRNIALSDDTPLEWIETENWQREEVSARGRLQQAVADKSILVIGAGAIGSPLAELLVRGGSREVAVIDWDRLEAGNLVRHTGLVWDIGQPKARTLSERLNGASLHGIASGITSSFPPLGADIAERLRQFDVVIDATGEDDVTAAMGRFDWGSEKTFISLSLGMYARRMFFFSHRGLSFPDAAFRDCLQPWLCAELAQFETHELPRDGPGCWHVRHPARIDDVWMLTAAAVKLIEQTIPSPPDTPSLAVVEQQVDESGNFNGVRIVQ